MHHRGEKSARRRITNWKTFGEALWAALKPYVRQLLAEEHLGRVIPGTLGAPSSRPNGPRGDEMLLRRIFISFREIVESVEMLNAIPVYLMHPPSPLPRQISDLVLVKYHVENYFGSSWNRVGEKSRF